MEIFRFLLYQFGMGLFFCILSIVLIITSIKSKSIQLRYILIYISTPIITLFLFELHYLYTNQNKSKTIFSGSFFDNPMVSGNKKYVGYGPSEDNNFGVSAIRKNEDSLIYSVVYSLQNGRRFTPNNNKFATKNIYFLGCSVTFGDGLNDNQTLPYFFSEYSNHNYNVINYGFSGYGTHQALKIIEEKIFNDKNIIVSDNDCAIYSFIPEHIERAAGHSIWDAQGPCYEVEESKLIYKGSFDEVRFIKQNYITKRIKSIWQNSALYNSFFSFKVKKKDVIRVAELIKRMHVLLKNHNIRFIVLIPKLNNNTNESILYQSIKQNKIEYYLTDSILNTQNLSTYKIEGDWHPNERYNMKIAEFLSIKLNQSN